jgi:hypothetical protein
MLLFSQSFLKDNCQDYQNESFLFAGSYLSVMLHFSASQYAL